MLVETRRKEGERGWRKEKGLEARSKKKNNKTLGCNLSRGYTRRGIDVRSLSAELSPLLLTAWKHIGRKAGMYLRTQPRFFFRRSGNEEVGRRESRTIRFLR